MLAWCSQWNGYEPGLFGAVNTALELPAMSTLNRPGVFDVTVCASRSRFCTVICPPGATVASENWKWLIVTVADAAAGGLGGPTDDAGGSPVVVIVSLLTADCPHAVASRIAASAAAVFAVFIS